METFQISVKNTIYLKSETLFILFRSHSVHYNDHFVVSFSLEVIKQKKILIIILIQAEIPKKGSFQIFFFCKHNHQ